MSERLCPGLPADWLNAWLAAIGALVLVPELRLRWTDDPVPLAVLTAPGDNDPAAKIAERWPTSEWVASLPIARKLPHHLELPLNPSVAEWSDRTGLARSPVDGWTLSSLYTDLVWDQRARSHVVERGQFHTPMPGRDNTMFDRLRKLVRPAGVAAIEASLNGAGERQGNYGLGFDVTRISSLGDESDQMVDPLIEVLAFLGLALFPTRGDGTRRRQRGWPMGGPMRWYAWSASLSSAAVDALIDVAERGPISRVGGLRGGWEAVSFSARGTSDVTRGYGSRRLEGPWDRR